MKVAVFTSNQPRHVSFLNRLASAFDEVFAVQECNTVFPGKVKDFFASSDVMREYFSRVIDAERAVFGGLSFLRSNISSLAIKSGDLNQIPLEVLQPMLECDYVVVFGASYIKAPLVDRLVERRAINIHMGVSPYYRGNSCNFWALYDRNPELLGATIHMLSPGLDSGAMMFHALPKPAAADPFEFGMRAVSAAHSALVDVLSDGSVFDFEPVLQDRAAEIRYTRNSDFNDTVAREYLDRSLAPEELKELLDKAPQRDLLRPRYY